MPFDPAAYRARLALHAPPARDAAGLAGLVLAHRRAIPFENLDVMLGRRIAIDSEAVFAKLVTARRGGFCFEHNRLLGDALAAFGFTARPLLARVWLGADEPQPLTHTLSLVTIGDTPWIADAGFGGSYAPPMPLVDGAMATAPDGARFRLAADPAHGWMLLRDGDPAATDGRGTGPGWQRQYSFTLAEVWPADLAMGSHWASTAPATRFTTHRIASLVLPAGFASFINRRWRHHDRGETSSGASADAADYRQRLEAITGIALTEAEADALGLF